MENPSIPQTGVVAQNSFQERFDLNDPIAAMASYAQQMRQITQRQMDNTTKGHCRNASSGVAPLSPESSVDSTNSLESVSSHS